MPAVKRPVVIDTDPGVDDTLALFLAAASEELDIRAINPVAGNVSLAYTARNTLYLRQLLGLNCRVGTGADKALLIPTKDAADVHGKDGLGGYPVGALTDQCEPVPAWDVLYEEAVKAEGALEVITLGPLTNVAIALLSYPELKGLIRQITMMAGSAGKGNITPYAEFNVYADPHAMEIVLRSGIPLYMCGLDGNESCALTREELEALYNVPGMNDLALQTVRYIYNRDHNEWGLEKSAIHDLITMACFIDPSIAMYVPCHCDCEIYDQERLGETTVDFSVTSGNRMNLHILRRADKAAYMEMIRKSMPCYMD